MATWREFLSSTETIAASTTVTFPTSKIAGPGVRRFLFDMTGAGNDFSDVSRIRIKSGSDTLYDCGGAALQVLLQRLTMSNMALAAADVNFQVPFCDLESGDQIAKELAGFPLGNESLVEVTFGAGAAAGTLRIGWELSDRAPRYVPKFAGIPMGVAASSSSANYVLPAGGWLRAYVLNTTGLNRAKLTVNGKAVVDLPGPLLLESERDEDPNTISNPICRTIFPMREVVGAGRSKIELDTAAGWAGAANEFTMLTWHPQDEEALRLLQVMAQA